MYKHAILMLLLFLFQIGKGQPTQQVISTCGGYIANNQGSFSVTIGELSSLQTQQSLAIDLILTQGFQQNNAGSVLPLKLVEFTGVRSSSSVLLRWKVLSESVISTYVIERSSDGSNFISVGSVSATTLVEPEKNYSFPDSSAGLATIYYRLLIKEKDGNSFRSWIIKLSRTGEQWKIYPNPVSAMLTIEVIALDNINRVLILMDLSGKIILKKNATFRAGRNVTTIDTHSLPAGNYILSGFDSKPILVIKE